MRVSLGRSVKNDSNQSVNLKWPVSLIFAGAPEDKIKEELKADLARKMKENPKMSLQELCAESKNWGPTMIYTFMLTGEWEQRADKEKSIRSYLSFWQNFL